MFCTVITTIQRPTDCVRNLAFRLGAHGGLLVVIGDSKGPDQFVLNDVKGFSPEQLIFLALEGQLDSGFELARLLPTKHYARKNIGYLQAIHSGASCIYETDDDNGPLDSWTVREEYLDALSEARSMKSETPAWVNVYHHFSDDNIWPRGLPLDRVRDEISIGPKQNWSMDSATRIWAPIQQGLADGAPDVDAIWRLVLDREFRFDVRESVLLPSGQWCPFNTQSTWWWPVVYPLLYVPSYCSFRMCDIWKSFVAQRCLWELGTGVVFHAAEVWQERNVHSLMRDFQDEIPGYIQNNRIAEILASTPLAPGKAAVAANLKCCYQSLVEHEIFPEKELQLVEAWLQDLMSLA
jgi:hypothetical protein